MAEMGGKRTLDARPGARRTTRHYAIFKQFEALQSSGCRPLKVVRRGAAHFQSGKQRAPVRAIVKRPKKETAPLRRGAKKVVQLSCYYPPAEHRSFRRVQGS